MQPGFPCAPVRTEVGKHDVGGGEVVLQLSAECLIEPGQATGKEGTSRSQELPYGGVEPFFTAGHGPIGHALIEKDRGKANQPRMDDFMDLADAVKRRCLRLFRAPEAGQEERF